MNIAKEIRRYCRVLWSWSWLILAGALLAGSANYYLSSKAPPRYVASATLMVGQIIRQANPDQLEIGLADRLVLYYLELLRRQPVLDGVKQELKLDLPNDVLSNMLGARVVPSTAFIELNVTDTDPVRVVLLVNAFSQELIKQSPTAPENTREQQRVFVQGQLDEFQSKIESAHKTLADLNQTLNSSTTSVEIAETNAKIKALQTQIDTWQANYIELLRTSNLSSPNSISILETSKQAQRVQTISPLLSASLAGGVGAFLAIICAFFLEYLDDRIKSGTDIENRLKLVVLGHVPSKKILKAKQKGTGSLLNLNREAVEAYEIISTSILFSEILSKGRKSIILTAPSKLDYQADIALDLAISMINFSKSILLVDADTAHPRLHELLGLVNRAGFFEIFYGGNYTQLEEKVLETAIPNLYLIPAGLSASHTQQLTIWNHGTQRIYSLPHNSIPGDFAIFNCDSILHDKTTRLLSSNITGTILLCELNRTRGQELKAAVDVVERLHGEVLGVVTLDRTRRKRKQLKGKPADDSKIQAVPDTNINSGAINLGGKPAPEPSETTPTTDRHEGSIFTMPPAAASQPFPDPKIEPISDVIVPPDNATLNKLKTGKTEVADMNKVAETKFRSDDEAVTTLIKNLEVYGIPDYNARRDGAPEEQVSAKRPKIP